MSKAVENERHVAHRRRPHEHAAQVDLSRFKPHSLESFQTVAGEVDGRRPDVRARVEHGELVPEEVDVVDVVSISRAPRGRPAATRRRRRPRRRRGWCATTSSHPSCTRELAQDFAAGERATREPGASFTQAIFVTETLARSRLKMDGTEVGPPVGQLRQRGTHTVETCESKMLARVLRH